MKGYRLHDQRMAFSGGIKSMRSIKYELVDAPQVAGLRDKVAKAIESDYRMLYGALNFNDYLVNKDAPSLLDFWLKALSLGFVFSNQNSIEVEFLKYLGKKTIWQQCYNELEEDFKNNIDEQKFCEFLVKSHRGIEKKTKENKEKIIYNLTKVGGEAERLSKVAQDWADNFKLNDDQLAFKCKIFSISMPNVPKRSMSLGFAIDPKFDVIDIKDRTEFLDYIVDFYETRTSPEQTKKFMAIGDNGNYFNSIFNGLLTLLKDGNLDSASVLLNDIYDLNAKAEIRSRLEVLKTLVLKIDEPKLVNKWSDYRSDFNGTIESWFSNRKSKQQAVIEQLDGKTNKNTGEVTGGLKELLSEIDKALPQDCDIKDGILRETQEYLVSHGKKIDRAFTNELDSYLATLRTDLNEWSQHNKNNSLPKNWQKTLSKRIQSSPLFFGENKRQLWEQLILLKSHIRNDIEKIEFLLKGNFNDYKVTNKQVDMLAQLYNRVRDNGNKEVIKILVNIQNLMRVNFSDRTELKRFYLSGYERAKVSQLEYTESLLVSKLIAESNLSKLLMLAKNSPQDDNLLRDVVQLSKIVVSALVRGSDKEREAKLLHSNLSGYANLISRKKFITRATVQAVNGGQLNLSVKGDKYSYAFLADKFTERDEALQFSKTYNFNSEDLGEKMVSAPYLEVRSSRYQVQFLDWFMGKHKKKKTYLGAGGAFSIAEKSIELNWNKDKPEIAKISDTRVFVSQPFEIKPKDEGKQVSPNRFIGVDIGEFGLAYCLIDMHNNKKVNILETGFIEDRQQHKLKYAVKSWRDSQVRATFNMPNTLVARIRDSLIGSYRNQLEDLAMKKDARLSFEYEVSNFETGSNRISKVYSSIKRGDIKKKDNKSENKMAWGDRGQNNWGFETTAAGTSQTCSKCKRWASLAIDIEKSYQLAEYQDGLFKATINDGEVRLLKNKDTKENIKGKDLKILIYKAMRPNEDGLGMNIVKRKYNWDDLSSSFGVGKPRGNIGIFVCPYTDCHHISDADIQASLNIALRGHLKHISGGKIKTAEDFVAQSNELSYSSIALI